MLLKCQIIGSQKRCYRGSVSKNRYAALKLLWRVSISALFVWKSNAMEKWCSAINTGAKLSETKRAASEERYVDGQGKLSSACTCKSPSTATLPCLHCDRKFVRVKVELISHLRIHRKLGWHYIRMNMVFIENDRWTNIFIYLIVMFRFRQKGTWFTATLRQIEI